MESTLPSLWAVKTLFLTMAILSTGDLSSLPAPAGDPLLGEWSGTATYLPTRESKRLELRVEMLRRKDKPELLVLYASVPEIGMRDLGPIPVQRSGDEYIAFVYRFRLLTGPPRRLKGSIVFDGHDLPFELSPGAARPFPAPPVDASPIAQPRWTFKTGGAIWSSPATAPGAVYFGSNDAKIYALDAKTGKLQWSFVTGGAVVSRPTVDGDGLYALSDDGFLYKIERRAGKLVWKFDTHGGSVKRELPGSGTDAYDVFASGATVANGIIYIGSADKRLYAVEAKSGRELWHFDTQGLVRSTPAVAGGRVFFGSRDHYVYALEARTGAPVWKHDTLREVTSSPLVAGNLLYVGSRSSDFLALDPATGKIRWSLFYWSSWVESSARILDGRVYVGSSDWQQLLALDAATGKPGWSFDTGGSAWSTPAVTDSRVFIGAVGVADYPFFDHQGGFWAADRKTGKAAWKYPMPPIPGSATWGVASSPAVAEGLVFFGGLDGTFYAFTAG
jgi:eukaryotic-like serine/threonine-protein kinase